MANEQLREACAGILEALPYDNPRRIGRLLRGADTLRWCERHEYGDPVPADEHDAEVEALKQALHDTEAERDEAQRQDKTEAKAFKRFSAAMVAFDDEREDIKALLDAWDEYRAVRS